MGLPSPFTAGAAITAAALTGIAPISGFKYADQNSGQSNTVLQNDTDLVLAFAAAGTYIFDGMIIYSASTAADYQATFAAITSATLTLWAPGIYTGTGGGSFVQPAIPLAFATTISAGGQGTAQNQSFSLQGAVVMGATAGTLQYQFAQNNSDASNCNTRAGSWLRAWQIA
jgi:hypothetical protein